MHAKAKLYAMQDKFGIAVYYYQRPKHACDTHIVLDIHKKSTGKRINNNQLQYFKLYQLTVYSFSAADKSLIIVQVYIQKCIAKFDFSSI